MIKQNEVSVGSNTSYNNQQPQSIKIRLDTSDLLKKIEIFLRGGRTEYFYTENDSGERILSSEYIKTGKKMCNDIGVQTLVNWISGVINPHVVQGNFLIDEKTGISKSYDDYIFGFNVDLISLVVINRYEWDMDIKDVEGVVDFIMLMVIPFMTRLIDNKERESYGTTLRSVETSNVTQGKGNPFGLGSK